MSKDEKPDNENQDPMTDLLRQMGLCEEEIGAALNLADSIEKKVEAKSLTVPKPTIPVDLKKLSYEELISLVEKLKSELNHFHNVVAVQLILIIKKYKDKVISLENKIQQKNGQLQELSQQLEFLRK